MLLIVLIPTVCDNMIEFDGKNPDNNEDIS